MKKIRNILLAVMVAACALIVAACSSGNEKKNLKQQVNYLVKLSCGTPLPKDHVWKAFKSQRMTL